MSLPRAMVLAAVLSCVFAAPASAISNGVPDGDDHPNVGLLAFTEERDEGPVTVGYCSGFYAGPRLGSAPGYMFSTAAHCLDFLAGVGIAPDQLSVTFDSEVAFADGAVVLSSNTWFHGVSYATDPQFGLSANSPHDFGVVVLESVPAGLDPVEMPTRGLLDQLDQQGALRPSTLFDSVGYGLMPTFKQGPVSFDFAPGRMFATSRFQGLTRNLLKLNMNTELEGTGGGCFGDSGAPKLIHDSNVAVAHTTGGDPLCRANSNNLRLDTTEARSFYGDWLELP